MNSLSLAEKKQLLLRKTKYLTNILNLIQGMHRTVQRMLNIAKQ